MIIKELLNQLDKRFPTLSDKKRMIASFYPKRKQLSIGELDCALSLFAMHFSFEGLNVSDLFKAHPNLVSSIADSSYAAILLPNLLNEEVKQANDEKTLKEIEDAILDLILNHRLPQKTLEQILTHNLSGDLDISLLDQIEANVVNAGEKAKLELHGNRYYSFALSQTKYKILSDIVLTNLGKEPLKGGRLIFEAEPDYLEISPINIPYLDSRQPVVVSEFDVHPHIDRLLDLPEKIKGSITVRFVNGEEELVSLTTEIEYFSFDTWLESAIPGSSALFVTPNEDSIHNLIALTAKESEKLYKNASLSGYLSGDKDEIIHELKSLYNVLHEQAIAYVLSPASFEAVGQKIRLPHDCLKHKQGNCLDLSLLFLSGVEALGLNGFLVHRDGHAFAGVFLEEDCFPTLTYLDAGHALELNSPSENQLVFIECTCLAAGNPASFEEALEAGHQQASEAAGDPEFKIIDIKRARSQGFLPLPISYNDVNRIQVDYQIIEQNNIRLARKEYSYQGEKLSLKKAELGKFDIWEKKLLDLSRRNQLINYKPTGRGLEFYFYDLNGLYQALENDNSVFRLFEAQGMNELPFELPTATEEQYAQIESDFTKKQLSLIYRNKNQENSLKFFDKERKKSFEETGSNILYLALGYVRYFEKKKSKDATYAPLILVPVDLVKNSRDNYSIKGREEPPFLNISILEFFHQEYGLNSDDLLTQVDFEGGNIDIDTLLNTLAERFKKLSRASILRVACLSVFNFSKAVMWSDIKYRQDTLSKHRVISSIIDGRYLLNEDEQKEDLYDDDKASESDLAIPLSADSSQIQAIVDASKGKSFILQGPPGTGKSQTITNMIVNAIYHGKTVLFVAEKMAALEVVQKRLAQLCLDRFALEAHSAKADKSSLMNQFEKRIQLGETLSDQADYIENASLLQNERGELNRIIKLLHKPNGYFLSFYDAFVSDLALPKDLAALKAPDAYLQNLDQKEFIETSRVLDALYQETLSNGGYRNNPFFLYREINYIPGLSKKRLAEAIETYQNSLKSLLGELDRFNQANDFRFQYSPFVVMGLKEYLNEPNENLKGIPNLVRSEYKTVEPTIKQIIELASEYEKQIRYIRGNFFDGIFDLSYESDYAELRSYYASNFIKKFFGLRKLLKKVQGHSKNPGSIKEEDLPKVYQSLEKARNYEPQLLALMYQVQEVFGHITLDELRNFDFHDFENRYQLTIRFCNKYQSYFSFEEMKQLLEKNQRNEKENILPYLENELSAEEKMRKAGVNFEFAFRNGYNGEKILSSLEEMLSHLDLLPNWCSLLSVYQEAKAHQISFIMDQYEKEEHLPGPLASIYQKAVYTYIIDKALEGDNEGSFNSIDLSRHVARYKELVDSIQKLIIKETASRVSKSMPSINENSPSSSQQGILNKAIRNKCRGKSIRQLFEEIKDILTRIFPVFLMSPISCAQYLSPDMPKFDIVIFDEASQMPTSEAIGAIARGNSLIVVGDSKQLPPTTFFQNKIGEDIDDELDDQESILDDCEVIGMPSKRLDWHYRSKHESLIRFSNAKFYGNGLVTFPSPNDRVSKVSFHNVKGVYGEKGATNLIEAKAIVAEVARRLSHTQTRDQSIGIVTFSSVQQELIDDLLNDYFATHKELEKIAYNEKEPLIVKNLENIQGDERDIILFSICYGPNKQGQLYYRFGPINNLGGEKRLNVAISRARYEMMVFASFEPEALASMHSDSIGANELYHFLKYAKYGVETLSIPNGSVIETKVGMERYISEKLNELGYETQIDVGKSSFRVDIGVVDPENVNEYLLGILCDSYSYENAKTARDRNLIQPNALEDLGWNLMRVYSFDYLDNPKELIQSIVKKIEDIQAHPESYRHIEKKEALLDIQFESRPIGELYHSLPYTSYNQPAIGEEADPSAKTALVQEILKLEAPISEDLLKARYCAGIGASRLTKKISDELLSSLVQIGAKKNQNLAENKTFYWRSDMAEDNKLKPLTYFRVGGEKPRNMDDIAKEEIFVAVSDVLHNGGPMSMEELKRFVAKAFELKVLGKKADETISGCLDYYLKKGELVHLNNGERIALKEATLSKKESSED